MFALCFVLCFGDNNQDLVNQLGSSSFAARNKAHATLAVTMDFHAYRRLRTMNIKDVEASRRVKAIVTNYEVTLRSKYQVNLMGYPKYPAIYTESVTMRKWLEIARAIGGLDYTQNWDDWRLATELWANQKAEDAFSRAICQADEAQFHRIMREEFAALQKELETMIAWEDAFWKGKENNPFRKVKGK